MGARFPANAPRCCFPLHHCKRTIQWRPHQNTNWLNSNGNSRSWPSRLNVIVRDAVCTALHAFNNHERSDAAKRFMDYNLRMIPKYWEPPELLKGYVKMWERDANV